MTHNQMKSVLIVTVFLCCCCAGREPATYPRFNPLCFQRRPQPVNQTSVSVSHGKEDALAFNFSFPKFQSIKWEFDYFIRPSCRLEIYLYGSFYVFEMFLKLIKTECTSLTKIPTKKTVDVIKTGAKLRPKGMPPLKPEWWRHGTLARVILEPIISYKPTTFSCTYSHEFITRKSYPTLHVNFTLDIRGCPEGLYGKHCEQKCACQNGGTCHPLDGSCLCYKEWIGRFCETVYPHLEVNGTTTAVIIGGQAHITCHAYAINVTSVSLRWMFTSRDGVKHESLQGDVLFNSSDRVVSLTIANFSEEMAGTYKCLLITKHGVFEAPWSISSKGCVTNTYGPGCEHTCDCQNGAPCDRTEGCVCTKQFIGSKCQISIHFLGIIIGLSFVALIVIPSACLALKHVYTVWKRLKDIAIIRDEQLQYQASKGNPWAEILPNITQETPENQLHERWGIPDEDVYIGKIIAEGSFSEIYKGHMIKKGKTYEVAIKMLKDDKNRQSVTDFFQEFQTLAEIYHHRHILQMLGIGKKVVAGQCKQIIIMEYMAKGSLLEVLRNSRAASILGVECASPPLTNGQLTNFIMDILNALAYLEFKQIIHRDIAARNMLVSSCMVVKLADFGFSRDVRTDGVYRLTDAEKKLPWKWMAYESLTDQVWTTKSDVWAFGILLWEVVTLGGAPYPGVTGPGRLIQMLQQTYRMEKPEHCSQEWYEIMKMCWDLDPEKRPRFAKLRCSFEKLKKNTLTHPQLDHYHGEHFAVDPEAAGDDAEDDCGLVPVDYPGTDGNNVPGYVNCVENAQIFEINKDIDEDNQSWDSVDCDAPLLPLHG